MTADAGDARVRRLTVAGCLVICLIGGVAGCGEQSLPPATLAVQSYLNALAEGNYHRACGLIAARTRRARARSLGRHVSCPAVFRRCLPDRAQVPSHDQSQLLFADTQVTIDGTRATATVSGTAVSEAIRRVTLAKEGRHWRLTSYGRGLRTCHSRRHARRLPRGRPRRPGRSAGGGTAPAGSR